MILILALLVGAAPLAAQQTSSPSAGAAAGGAGELAGSSWQLVKILSMDDSVDEPEDPQLYRLEFMPDGTASIVADCNRGTGAWTSQAPGQLVFGPIASTKALCPPGSLSEKFLAQFQWVRSYTLKDRHLFLATMADGSIIELEPLETPVAATVLGEPIRTDDAGEMQAAIITRLFERYVAEHGIKATEPEVDAWVENMRSGMEAAGLTADEELTPEEAAEVGTMRREMARSIIRQWKLNRALYKQYGGRIIFQQFGPEPLDAYRRFLVERQKAGDFSIEEQSFEAEFWRYFTDDSIHTFFEKGSEEEAMVFEVPPWERRDAAK
jgi:heat shock protein HslJ